MHVQGERGTRKLTRPHHYPDTLRLVSELWPVLHTPDDTRLDSGWRSRKCLWGSVSGLVTLKLIITSLEGVLIFLELFPYFSKRTFHTVNSLFNRKKRTSSFCLFILGTSELSFINTCSKNILRVLYNPGSTFLNSFSDQTHSNKHYNME